MSVMEVRCDGKRSGRNNVSPRGPSVGVPTLHRPVLGRSSELNGRSNFQKTQDPSAEITQLAKSHDVAYLHPRRHAQRHGQAVSPHKILIYRYTVTTKTITSCN
ncbi:hypothetical protein G7K_1830-t1 [Saitoella complicata NRRL Y-17804]|uniref:Uncharacterized protein n=1 Tax=Saitoella complicata (strain BCRC 22490 / CBS 7301 / JCM 7358 / NBRC 10748 / NRRL Y-17804) TaxID=698492 RepID=A0A0E9NDZ3_SAICN|nr:hypothetical protein G7K_1830-t1 [Saitoella complicata NRRL Y-17804]